MLSERLEIVRLHTFTWVGGWWESLRKIWSQR